MRALHRRSQARRPLMVGVGLLGVVSLLGSGTTAGAAAKKPAAKSKSSSKATSKSSKGAKLLPPNATGVNPAVPFNPVPASDVPGLPSAPDVASAWAALNANTPTNKVLLIALIGSDARPGEKVERSRADSIHVFSYNLDRKKGVLFSFPRDTQVVISGRNKKDKINASLSTGGPEVMMSTLRAVTGLPIQKYVITGFAGIENMVNQLQGVTVNVDPQMSDKGSGAYFQKGWFKMNGRAALSYARARKSLPKGDLDRVFNQYRLMFYAGIKLRTETSTIKDLSRWVEVGKQNTVTNLGPSEWLYYAQIARDFNPEKQLDFVRVPGKIVGVNYAIGAEAQAFFADVRADGFRGQ